MSMDQTYQALFTQTDALHYKIHDAFDDPNHPSAQRLTLQLKELLADCELQRNPRDVEQRIIAIKDLLHQARSEGQGFLGVSDAINFFDRFEDMRRIIRGHQHYA